MDLQFGQRSTCFGKYFWPYIRLLSCFASVLVYSSGASSDGTEPIITATPDPFATTSSPYPLITAPVLNPPFISGIRNISDSNGNQVELQGLLINCTIGYTQTSTPNGARFRVIFYADNQLFYDWGDADSTHTVVSTSEGMLDGFFQNNITCTTSSFWETSPYVRSPPLTSNTIQLPSTSRYLYPPMTAPVLSPPFDTEVKNIRDINGDQVKVQGMGVNCTIGYTQTNKDDGAEFYVAFYFDNNDSHSIGYWTQTPNTPVPTQEGVLDKYFGRNITCSVISFWISTRFVSPTFRSNTYQLPSPAQKTSVWTTTPQPPIPLLYILLGVLIPAGVIVIVVMIVVCVACKRNWCKKKTTETNYETAIALDNYQKLQIASSGGGGNENLDKIADPFDGKNEYDDEIVPQTNEENKYDYLDLDSELVNNAQHSQTQQKSYQDFIHKQRAW